jgi:tetratricopeptide (TPR) repeat protein
MYMKCYPPTHLVLARSLFNLGEADANIGQYETAVQHYKRAIDIHNSVAYNSRRKRVLGEGERRTKERINMCIQGGKCWHPAPKNTKKCWTGAEVLSRC